MATNYYPSTDDTAESAPAAPDTEGTAGEQKPNDELGETALVPKSILAGKELQPGDTVTFKVVHLYDDEIELRPANEPKETEPEPKGMNANEEIDMMAGMPRKGMM